MSQNIKDKMINILIFGQKGSGKTTLTKHLINEYSNIYYYIIIFKRFKTGLEYAKERKFTFKKLYFIVSKQKEFIREGKRNPLMIVFDDCVQEFVSMKKHEKKLFIDLFFNARHMLISIIFNTQYLNLLQSFIRNNFDVIFLKQNLNSNIMDKFIKSYVVCENYKKTYEEIKRNFLKDRFYTYKIDLQNGGKLEPYNYFI